MNKISKSVSLIAVAFIAQGASGAFAREAAAPIVLAQAAQKAEKVSGQAEGVIKAIDAEDRKLLINHGPVKGTLEMAGMTMPFKVAPGIDLAAFKPGAKVKFTVTRDEKGLFLIEKIEAEK